MAPHDIDAALAAILEQAGAAHVELILTFEDGQTVHHEAGEKTTTTVEETIGD